MLESGKRLVIGWVGSEGYDILYEEGDAFDPDLSPEDDYVEDWRRKTLPNLHNIFTRFDGYAQYPLGANEYAGTIREDPETVETILWDNGLIRNPLAALKTDPLGNTEVGSWMYREERTADRQVHVMLFQIDSGQEVETDLYAHKEYSAGHPDPGVAIKHYRGEDYDPEAGVDWVQANLPITHQERQFDQE